jgi:hypothetical protein
MTLSFFCYKRLAKKNDVVVDVPVKRERMLNELLYQKHETGGFQVYDGSHSG